MKNPGSTGACSFFVVTNNVPYLYLFLIHRVVVFVIVLTRVPAS